MLTKLYQPFSNNFSILIVTVVGKYRAEAKTNDIFPLVHISRYYTSVGNFSLKILFTFSCDEKENKPEFLYTLL